MNTPEGQAVAAFVLALLKYLLIALLYFAVVILIMFILGTIIWALMSLLDGGIGKVKPDESGENFAGWAPNFGIGNVMHQMIAQSREAALSPEAQMARSKFKENLSKLGQHMQSGSAATSVSINTHTHD